jgi:dihydroorotase
MDLILRHAHVIDPSQEIGRILYVCSGGSKIAAVGESLAATAGCRELDLRGKYLCPGLVDLHGHWYEGSAWGIDPNICLNHGVTTAVDAGTCGFVNFGEFRRNRIETAAVQVLAFVNICANGIPTALVGELEDLRYARPRETAAMIEANPAITVGVKLREGTMTGTHGKEALTLALEAADSVRLPLMVHVSQGADTPAILRRLRAGDILTHCFQGRGDGLLEAGEMIPEALEARKNGVQFDVGHGYGSFRWETAKRAFEHFFFPDTISTDLHRYSVARFAMDMPTTMSKFLHLGMALRDVVLKTTWAPAQAIGRHDELGTLRIGSVADLFVFDVEEGEFALEDTHLQVEKAGRRIRPQLTVKSGKVVECGSQQVCLRPLYLCDQEIFQLIERNDG